MQIMVLLVVAVSLSMDAFSLSLAYGTLNLPKKNISLLSIIVGIYHFIMPLLGLCVGSAIINHIKINPDLIVCIVLIFIGLEMFFESFKKEEKVKAMNYLEMLIFGFAVSVDSFSVGIGLRAIHIHPIICSCIFSLCAFFFTYIGLLLGKKINLLIGKLATILGGLALIIIGIIYAL